jgi:hypothetical protein
LRASRSHTNTDGYCYGYTQCYANSHSYTYSQANTHRQAERNPEDTAHSAAAAITL